MKCPNCRITLKTENKIEPQGKSKLWFSCRECEFTTTALHLKIDHFWAFIMVDEDNNEGVPAIQVGERIMPLVCADVDRVDSFRAIAKRLAVDGNQIKLVKFSQREVLETYP